MSPKPKEEPMSWGCVGLLFVFAFLVWGLVSCASGENLFDRFRMMDEEDCNDIWIEQDYNGDGEKDAEDFRIQTDACE